jgi:hypothetical protein
MQQVITIEDNEQVESCYLHEIRENNSFKVGIIKLMTRQNNKIDEIAIHVQNRQEFEILLNNLKDEIDSYLKK